MFKEKISLILPAHNEDENIKSLIQNIYQTFKENNLENLLEVIVVNDGSKDNTENEVNKMVKQYNNLILINLKSNVGKAYALDIGINNSNGKIIAIMDADLQYSAKNLINMINLINEGYDLVNGKRENRKDSYFTVLFSNTYNLILRLMFKMKLNDFFSGIKVYKKEIYELMNYNGMARFVVFFSKKFNYKIYEMPVSHFHRLKGKTSYSFFDKIILCLKDVFTIIICISLGKNRIYQIKQFILSVYFISILIFIIDSFFYKYFDNQIIIFFIFSFLLLCILNMIIQTFLSSKEKKLSDLMSYIKNIKKR